MPVIKVPDPSTGEWITVGGAPSSPVRKAMAKPPKNEAELDTTALVYALANEVKELTARLQVLEEKQKGSVT
jgi:hypothetical protein